jgi:hypothetical protein
MKIDIARRTNKQTALLLSVDETDRPTCLELVVTKTMERFGKTRNLLGKLSLGLLLACFLMAGTNMLLFSSIIEREEENRDRTKNAGNINPIDNPPNMFPYQQQQKKKPAIVAVSKPSEKHPPPKQPASSRKMPRNEAVYTCTYGKSKENRTTVMAPKNEPTFVIIGVQKSGTTALLTHFRDHPQVLQTKLKARREAHFFDTAWLNQVIKPAENMGLTQANDKHCLALEQYMKIFETETILANSQTLEHYGASQGHNNNNNANDTHHFPLYTFEKTPSYFGNPKIPARIKRTVPWSKTILVLRNPVERLYSHYKMTVKTTPGFRKYSIEDFVFHEVKAMRRWNMTTAPLMEPVNVLEGNNATDPSIPVLAEHYKMPETVPFDHAVLDAEQWTPKLAILKKPDIGPFGFHFLVRKGLYSTQLKWWVKQYTVGVDLLVINYDDLSNDIRSVYEQVCHFSGIPLPYDLEQNQSPSDVGIDFDKKVRADSDKTERPLKNETRSYLEEFYAPYTAELEALLGPEWSAEKLGWDAASRAIQ